VWQAFGFMSAVEKGREIIELVGTEVESNPRLYVIQLFGSDSGYVVSHAVLAASRRRLCDVALIPEIEFSMPELAKHMRTKIRERRLPLKPENPWALLPGGMVVMAETAIPTDALDYVDDPAVALIPKEKDAIREYCRLRTAHRRIQGQTDEHLRSAGLKIVSQGLAPLPQQTPRDRHGDPDWVSLRVFTNEPRHQLRAIPPSCTDIIFGSRLGTLAVDNAMAGYTDFMISQWLTEYVLVPLQLVVLGRKRIPETGMFWQSVIAKTGQPADLKDGGQKCMPAKDASAKSRTRSGRGGKPQRRGGGRK
jgi:6-phosphofructokinase 1